MPPITLDDSIVRFFVNPPLSNLKPSIYEEAANRAYGDMSRHTLHYSSPAYIGQGKTAVANKNALKSWIANEFRNAEPIVLASPNAAAFDKWHVCMCNRITTKFTTPDPKGNIPVNPGDFSDGQSQKVVNMMWKYVYLFYEYFNALSPSGMYNAQISRFKGIFSLLHAPVDSYVIDAATNPQNKYYLGCKKPVTSWSKMNYSDYYSFQTDMRSKLSGCSTPFLWELENFPFK